VQLILIDQVTIYIKLNFLSNIILCNGVINNLFSAIMSHNIILVLYILLLSPSIVYATTEPSSTFDSEESSTWKMGEKVPTARTEHLAEAINEKIYVIGGVDYSKGRQVDKVEVYDTKTDEWITSAKSMPQAIDHSAAAAYNGKIYVAGGFLGGKIPTDKLFIYDPKKDEWEEGKPLPSPRAALTAEFINGTLYAVGGLNSSQLPVNTNEAYDPVSNTWATKRPMPTARHHMASAVIDGKLFVMGGRVLGDGVPSEDIDEPLTNFNRNEMYDPETDSWVVKQPMLDKRSGLAATCANGQIYVFGGEGVKKAFDSVEKYDPANNKWTYEQSMPSGRMGLDAVTLDNKIYTIGGHIVTPESRIVALDVNEILSVKNENETNK
jgi:N-acetylneuraminic acid mutarotase